MRINDYLFNEMQTIENNPMANEYFNSEIYPQIAKQETDTSDLQFWLIPEHSLLMAALIKYAGSRDKALAKIRSAVEAPEGIYFATGYGYDIISSDLLGGSADGQETTRFLNWVNAHD